MVFKPTDAKPISSVPVGSELSDDAIETVTLDTILSLSLHICSVVIPTLCVIDIFFSFIYTFKFIKRFNS